MRFHPFLLALALHAIPLAAAESAAPVSGLGPYLGPIELREKTLPLLKAGTMRVLPPEGSRAQAIAKVGASFRAASLDAYGWRVLSSQDGFAALEGDPATMPLLESAPEAVPGLRELRPVRKASATLEAARRLSRVDGILKWGPAANPDGLSGKGVLVGIIDYGYDTRHPAFLDSAGGSRFLAIWDPNLPYVAGAPFNRGQLKRKAELEADSAFGGKEMDLHGTHVASIAVGSDRGLPYHGVAPGASILGLNLSNRNDSVSTETNVMQGIQWMFRVADSLNMPCVVNLSLGNAHVGPHDGTSLFDRFIDSVSRPGRMVVGAVGNDGNKKLHARLSLAADTVGTWCPMAPSALIDLWGEAGKHFRYQVLLMDSASRAYTAMTSFLATSAGVGRPLGDSLAWTDPKTNRKIPVLITVVPERAARENGKPRVLIRVRPGSKDTALAPRGVMVGVRLFSSGGATTVHAWNAETDAFSSQGMAGFVAGDDDHSLSEIGGTSKSILSAGAYVTTKAYRDYTGALQDGVVEQEVGEAAVWSSQGPSIDGRAKPDISAPGRLVVAALSRAVTSTPPWQTARIVVWPDPDALGGRYLAAEGTSQAAPFVTGVVALMLEAKPDLTAAQVRAHLAGTAYKDSFTGPLSSPDPRWGFGKVDAAAAVRRLRDIPVASRPVPGSLGNLKATLAGAVLRVEGLPAGRAVRARLHDWKGRRVSSLVPLGGNRFLLASGAPGAGVYIAVFETPSGIRRLRIHGG